MLAIGAGESLINVSPATALEAEELVVHQRAPAAVVGPKAPKGAAAVTAVIMQR